MAVEGGYYKTNGRPVPALVFARYAEDGTHDDTLADGATDTVDVVLVGVDSGVRSGVTAVDTVPNAEVNQFAWSLS